MKDIYVKKFSQFPGPRREAIGPNSGERFRDEVLHKELRENPGVKLRVILDGTAGYGSSFLEEAFGGLVRLGIPANTIRDIVANLVSEEDPSLIEEIKEYVDEALDEAER
ncbi:STAS-like domain-containing protein [Pseudomonas syringae]|uniref:STAS-like domain-containing protein n=1 Tax=Pseudomonas syringae TaxID=317 RepID=UPI001F0F3915|nr:STAS-like domain-containing protein [Pseudomonas syringae]MCH5486764.1 STAS-like domain-containing protein [Pseudomonas syringae pv. syringae]MDO1457662.1 STAS-like domain-containing protein [Pseudomonas syringae pv. syringae]